MRKNKMNNIRIAKQLIKLAKSLVAFQLIGDAFYRVISDNQISVNFSIETTNTDQLTGWHDAMTGRPTEVATLGKKYGFQIMKDVVDTVATKDKKNCSSICLKGNANCKMERFKEELKKVFNCNEIK